MIFDVEEYVVESKFLRRDLHYQLIHAKELNVESVFVLFVQDGDDYLELGNIQHCYQQLLTIQPTEAQKLVLVLVPPGTSIERYNFYHSDGNRHQDYVNFFIQELVPTVTHYFTQKRLNIKKIGLLGDSLGGAISLSIACTDPLNWTHLLLQSAAFTEKNFIQACQIEHPLSWNVYQVVGIKEDTFVSSISGKALFILSNNRKMQAILEELEANVTYFEEDEDHLWDFWRRDLPRALSFFLSN